VSWRTPITLAILLAVLLGAAYYGWQTIASPSKDDEPTAKVKPRTCKKTTEYRKGQRIASSDITVNVYNAGSISGLADDTLRDLHDQGFRRGIADNAPPEVSAHNVTVLTDAKNSPVAQLVARQFRGNVRIASGPALADGTDVIVGDGFKGVSPDARTFLRLKKTVRTCTSAVKAD
jgi:hypothetical protein